MYELREECSQCKKENYEWHIKEILSRIEKEAKKLLDWYCGGKSKPIESKEYKRFQKTLNSFVLHYMSWAYFGRSRGDDPGEKLTE